jgi:hypothetical protein
MPLYKFLPQYFRMFGLFEPKQESVEPFYTDSEQCGTLRALLAQRTGKKEKLERFLKDSCAYRFWWNREPDADKLRKQLYKVMTFTHIGEKTSEYAGKDQIMQYIDTSLDRLKTLIDTEGVDSPKLDDIEESLTAWCMEARLVDFLGKINQDAETETFNNEGAIQYKTQFSEQLVALLLTQEFYDQYLSNWSSAAASNASEGAKAAGASKLAEGVAAVSAKTKDNKDYTGFILSKLAEIVAEKESAGNTNIDNLLMMGIEADIPTLQDLYKKGYLKIPESYFTGGGNNKTAIIESLLDLFDISDAEKETLRIRLEKASIEKLKTTLAQRRQKAGLARARKQTRKRQTRKRQTRKN